MKRRLRMLEPHFGSGTCLPHGVRPPAASVLGSSHPLVETIETLAEARRQAAGVGAILVASLASAWAGFSWAQTAVLCATAMTCVLAVAVLELRRRKRRHALDLILEGREELPVAAVEEERRRLLDARGRSVLASNFDSLGEDALAAARWPAASVLRRETVAGVADELRDIGSLLRSEPSSARGVALARSLLTDVTRSPLYRREPGALHGELRRIRFLLQSSRP